MALLWHLGRRGGNSSRTGPLPCYLNLLLCHPWGEGRLAVLGARANWVQSQGLEAPQPGSFPLLEKGPGRDGSCCGRDAETPAP